GVGMRARLGDEFGFSVAAGHYRGSRFSDLAISVPGRDGVVVLAGSPRGLRAPGSAFLRTGGPLGGAGLAAAEFNGDGFTDLAVGDPFAGEMLGASGKVEIVDGSTDGLVVVAPRDARMISASTPGVPGFGPSSDANFGFALAAGDFNGDGFADLG